MILSTNVSMELTPLPLEFFLIEEEPWFRDNNSAFSTGNKINKVIDNNG